MKFAFDIGGVISKYPCQFRALISTLLASGHDVYCITDMHDKEDALRILRDNDLEVIHSQKLFVADYPRYGDLCKAVLLKELEIDFFFDDFGGYVQWDSQLGPAPIRLLVAPDPFKPYWHPDWECSGGEFGRRVCPVNITGQSSQSSVI